MFKTNESDASDVHSFPLDTLKVKLTGSPLALSFVPGV